MDKGILPGSALLFFLLSTFRVVWRIMKQWELFDVRDWAVKVGRSGLGSRCRGEGGGRSVGGRWDERRKGRGREEGGERGGGGRMGRSHLDPTCRARAATLGAQVHKMVAAVGAMPWRCLLVYMGVKELVCLRLVFRSTKLLLSTAAAVLNLLDWPRCAGLAFSSVWSRFRQLMSFMTNHPREIRRVFVFFLQFVFDAALGHGPMHLLGSEGDGYTAGTCCVVWM